MPDISSLILYINNANSKTLPLVYAVECIRKGIKSESRKIPELVSAYEKLLVRIDKEMKPSERRHIALFNTAVFAAMADHSENSHIDEYKKLENYGPAMTAIAEYVGIKGPGLVRFLDTRTATEVN